MERVRRPRAGRGEAARPRATPPPSAGLLALQRSAGNRAVAGMLQRALRHDPGELGATSYDDEAGGGTAVPLATLVQAIVKAEPGLADKEDAVTEQLQRFDQDDPPDLSYDSVDSVVKWLAQGGVKPDGTGKREKKEKNWDEAEDAETEDGMQLGKLFFPGQTYHREVKPAIISAIGDELRTLTKRRDAHNYNFWFDTNGEIYVDVNSKQTKKGKATGYAWVGNKVVKL